MCTKQLKDVTDVDALVSFLKTIYNRDCQYMLYGHRNYRKQLLDLY